jgi:DNA-binding SARP family transcriptional activator/ATP/maltotriose-dependent transcriptional regulator MalT
VDERNRLYVTRERLLGQLLESRIGVVEAGAGFGKSVLASQYREALGLASVYVPLDPADGDEEILIASIRRALRNGRLSDLVSATDVARSALWVERLLDALAESSEGVLVILDDVHHLSSPEAAALVIRLARGLPPQHRLLVAARRLLRTLEPVWSIPDAVRVTSKELAFTVPEAAELVRLRTGATPGEHHVRILVEATEGWATALVLAAAAGLGDGAPHAQWRDPIAVPLNGILDSLSDDERGAVIQLAHLPLITPELAGVVAGSEGAFARMVAVGVPLARADWGWWEMPGPVASHLASRAPLLASTVRAAAELYGRRGETLAAIRMELAGGLTDEAAARLAATSPPDVEDLGLPVVRDVVESLPAAAVRGHPRVLLHLARVAEIAHRADVRSDALARARAAARGALARELDAELARDLMWDERTRGQARKLAEAVIATAGPEELIARARALDVLGRLGTWFQSGDPAPKAESHLEESARLARRAGQRTWAAQALIPLAMGVYFATCRYERALEVLADALGDLPGRNRYRAMVQTFRAELLIELARFSEAESCLAEMRDVGRFCGEEWIAAYVAWNRANLASYRGDAAGTVSAVLEVERHRDEWYERPSGVEFLAQAADYLDRVGEHRQALDYLAQAEERMAGSEHHVRVYGAAVRARSGDPVEAEAAIEDLLAEGALEPQERWPLLLLRAHAARRQGDPSASRLAAVAFDTCLELGHPDGPLIREPTIAETLLPLAASAGSHGARALLGRRSAVSIRLLGGFEITRAGSRLSLPPGRPAKAVRAVAVAGGRLHADELIEMLWPNSSLVTGRSRLRNLLSRLRGASGEILERDGEMIHLPGGHEIDAEQFREDAEAARVARSAGDERHAAALARSALGRYRGDLLPDDRYEDWTAIARERLRSVYLDLLDLLAGAAEEQSDFDETIRMIARGIDVEPYDEQRYVRLARLLWSQGRAGSALATLTRARAALAELGLDPSDDLVGLEREIGRRG